MHYSTPTRFILKIHFVIHSPQTIF